MSDFSKLRHGDRCPVCNGPLLDIGVAAPRMVCKERECDRVKPSQSEGVDFEDQTTDDFFMTPWGPVPVKYASANIGITIGSPAVIRAHDAVSGCANPQIRPFTSPKGSWHCLTCGACF